MSQVGLEGMVNYKIVLRTLWCVRSEVTRSLARDTEFTVHASVPVRLSGTGCRRTGEGRSAWAAQLIIGGDSDFWRFSDSGIPGLSVITRLKSRNPVAR